MLSRVKEFIQAYEADIVLVIGILLVSIMSFGLGRLSAGRAEHTPIRIEEKTGLASYQPQPQSPTSSPAAPSPSHSLQAQVVASKNGTRYYFPWCSGVKLIKESNKIRFTSEAEAKQAGYELAANCN